MHETDRNYIRCYNYYNDGYLHYLKMLLSNVYTFLLIRPSPVHTSILSKCSSAQQFVGLTFSSIIILDMYHYIGARVAQQV